VVIHRQPLGRQYEPAWAKRNLVHHPTTLGGLRRVARIALAVFAEASSSQVICINIVVTDIAPGSLKT